MRLCKIPHFRNVDFKTQGTIAPGQSRIYESMMKMVGKNFCTNDSSRPKAFNGKGFAFHMRRPQSSSSSSTWASLSLSEAAEAAAIASRLVLRLFEAGIEAVEAGIEAVDDMTVVVALGGGTGGFGAEVFRLFLFL